MDDSDRRASPGPWPSAGSCTTAWKCLSAGLALVLIAQLTTGVGHPKALEAQRAGEVSEVILKFGNYYVNANAISYVRLSGPEQGGKAQVFFSGDSQRPLELSREEGEMMRPWLEGHSFDLSASPEPDPLPQIRVERP